MLNFTLLFIQRVDVRGSLLALARVTLALSSMFTSSEGSESISTTCTSLGIEGFFISTREVGGVAFCAFVFASEGPVSSSVAFSCCSLEDVLVGGEEGGTLGFWTLCACNFDLRVQTIKK